MQENRLAISNLEELTSRTFVSTLVSKQSTILQHIYNHPFIVELANGKLDENCFKHFIEQDALYLHHFAKGLALLAAKCEVGDSKFLVEFCEHAKGAIVAELDLHQSFLTKWNSSVTLVQHQLEQSPTCLLYTSHLKSVAYERPLHEALAAYLPCFWIYMKVGKHLATISVPNNKYQPFIDVYSSEGFEESVDNAMLAMENLASKLTVQQQEMAIQQFILTSKMEWMFWDAAYKQEHWPNINQQYTSNQKDTIPSVALTIAGSDSGGGAGIQADLKTFQSNGVFGTSVITAITAQNSQGVQGVQSITPEFVVEQMTSVFSDFQVKAVKTGMLFDKDIISAVAMELEKYKQTIFLVVDPVMVSTSGHTLLKYDAIQALLTQLMPMATLITPNIPEAQVILNYLQHSLQIQSVEDMKVAAKYIANELHCANVMIKGGHLQHANAIDVIYSRNDDEFLILDSPMLQTCNTHGTGCTLSAAITSLLAKGIPLQEAINQSKKFVYNAIQNGFRLGKGQHGTLNHKLQ